MEPQKIVIIETNPACIYILDYDPNMYGSAEEFFAQEKLDGISNNNCQYMIVNANELVMVFTP